MDRRPELRNLVLATLSFAVCFAAWGSIGAFAPAFRQSLHLSSTETALLVAIPLLLEEGDDAEASDTDAGRTPFGHTP